MIQKSKSDNYIFPNFEFALLACRDLFSYAACKGYLATCSANRDTRQCSCTIHLGEKPPFELPANYFYTDFESDEHDYVSDFDGCIYHVKTITYYFIF